MKSIVKIGGLLLLSSLVLSCKTEVTTKVDEQPLFQIRNGRFDVTAIISFSDSTYSGMPMGSGTIGFDWEGETTGNFSVTGSMEYAQKETPGVAAIIAKIFDIDFEVYREGLSLLAFKPVGQN
ncbi:MAG: hypothetical protein D6743_09810, partial [Calditrichaeota bacterium]